MVKIDLTEWMVDFVENYPESFKKTWTQITTFFA
jgi:hypothetical protein